MPETLPSISATSLPFQEQIAFFRGKVNLPTKAWTDIWNQTHDQAFVVAGAMRDDMLADFRSAVDKAISQGTTLEEFRKDFDRIVDQYGWSYNGGRNWRSKVIYGTNLRTSYMAGQYAQLQASKEMSPYWMYKHSELVQHPRPEHVAWDGLVLHADDPWWNTHFPPNGWGCMCRIVPMTKGALKRSGRTGPDTAPPLDMQTVTVGTRGPTPRTVEVPAGIDPGFGYAPGKLAWERQAAQRSVPDETAQARREWKPATPSNWQSYDRPARVPADKPGAGLAAYPATTDEALSTLRQVLGGDDKVFDVHGTPVLVDAQKLVDHIRDDLARAVYLPLIPETLTDPYEVWVVGETTDAGDFRIRMRTIKVFQLDKDRALTLVMDSTKGIFSALTVFPTSDLKYLNRQRVGVLIYGR